MTLRAPADFRGAFRVDAEACAVYSEGAGIEQILPRAIAVPVDAEDVSALVRWASRERVPLTARGSGSSMANGAVGPDVVVDLSRLSTIGVVDTAARRVVVGPGAVRDAVDRAARAHGLHFPPHPSSGAYCTIGGMTATNAAGAETLRYGATRPWITGVECVFADGTRGWVRRGAPLPEVPMRARLEAAFAAVREQVVAQPRAYRLDGVRKNSSGYALREWTASGDVLDLLIGSEGTLVLFTAIECALAPVPGATATVLAAFDTLEQAVEAAMGAREAGASSCELLDRTFLDVVREGHSTVEVPGMCEAVLLAGIEAQNAAAAQGVADAVSLAFRAAGAGRTTTAFDVDDQHALWALRHAASPTITALFPQLASMQFIEDGCVPPGHFAEYVRGVREILERYSLRGVIFGHAGDAHAHVNPLVDVRASTWRATVDGVFAETVALVHRLGGTLAGEHGDGRLRAPALAKIWSAEAVAAFGQVKEAFDAGGVLNPGVILPATGRPPFVQVKYDPSVPPLPPRARAVLERVATGRRYADFRLGMLESEMGAGLGDERVPN